MKGEQQGKREPKIRTRERSHLAKRTLEAESDPVTDDEVMREWKWKEMEELRAH